MGGFADSELLARHRNDAPDEFFDALLASSRGETPAEETAGTRTTVRTKTTTEEKEKATSSYTGAMSRGKISKTPTRKVG